MQTTRIIGTLLALTGCAGSPVASPDRTAGSGAPRSELERLFPLEDGMVHAYETDDNGDKGLIVTRSRRTGERDGDLVTAARSVKHFHYAEEEIQGDHYAVVLKQPLTVGTTWSSAAVHRTTISRVNVDATVPAGTFHGCLETTEVTPSGSQPDARTRTVFCPDVGIVSLDVEDGHGGNARVLLKSYARAVD